MSSSSEKEDSEKEDSEEEDLHPRVVRCSASRACPRCLSRHGAHGGQGCIGRVQCIVLRCAHMLRPSRCTSSPALALVSQDLQGGTTREGSAVRVRAAGARGARAQPRASPAEAGAAV